MTYALLPFLNGLVDFAKLIMAVFGMSRLLFR